MVVCRGTLALMHIICVEAIVVDEIDEDSIQFAFEERRSRKG